MGALKLGRRFQRVLLQHQDADHGLVRLMVWDGKPGDGLGVRPMRGLGSRSEGNGALKKVKISKQDKKPGRSGRSRSRRGRSRRRAAGAPRHSK